MCVFSSIHIKDISMVMIKTRLPILSKPGTSAKSTFFLIIHRVITIHSTGSSWVYILVSMTGCRSNKNIYTLSVSAKMPGIHAK